MLFFVLLFGGETRYIIETGISSLGKMIQNFFELSTYTDPLRTTEFPQNWTILITMVAFYATSFDSIALTASCYSYHSLENGKEPDKIIQLMWCILLILLPIALLFAESSMSNLQSVSIIAAFPIGIVIVMITISFFKDAGKCLEEKNKKF